MVFSFPSPVRRVLRKRRAVLPSAWVERHRVVTMSSMPGPWRNDVTPYLAGIMDASFFPSVRKVIVCKAPQTGLTEGAINSMLYAVDRQPGPVLFVFPDRDMARENSSDRIQPAITSSPRVSQYLTGRDDDLSGTRINLVHMPVYLAWAHSASRLANKPIKHLYLDEVDKYPAQASRRETSPINLAEARLTTYQDECHEWMFSSPSIEQGPIWRALTTEAQVVFRYEARCPHCAALQAMVFDQIRKPEDVKDPEEIEARRLAWYVCPECGGEWTDRLRDQAVREGRWVAWFWDQTVDNKGGFVRDASGRGLMEYLRAEHPGKIGFHVPSWLSRFVSLAKVMASFRRGLADRDALKDFLNKHAAEPWRVLVRESSADELLQGRGVLPRQVVPQEAVGITCGIDVQKYGFWFVVRAWANDFSSWLIDYGHLATWEDVETLLFDTRWPVDASERTAGIWRAAVDTGGGEQDGSVSMTEETYFWLRRNGSGRGCRVWGTKGASRLLAGKLSVGKPLDKAPSGKPIQGGLQIVSLNTDALKDTVTYRLEQARSGGAMPAWLHQDTGDDYARQILAEAKQVDDKGVECWVQLRKDNHLLDCEVMCHALADPEWPGGGVNLLRPAGTPAPGRRVRSSGVRV
jgi:phage terminase large subunit GpA-like protein